jgi:hypothetical protein
MNWTPRVDYQLLIVRSLLSTLALGVLVLGWWLRKTERGEDTQASDRYAVLRGEDTQASDRYAVRKGKRLGRTRAVALGVLSATVLASAYGFFAWRHPGDVQTHEFYHYYLNAKYFPELGYFDLYRCTVAAMAAERGEPQQALIRDLRGFLETTVVDTADIGERCDGAFSNERWAQFRTDLRWFGRAFVEGQWKKVLTDQGFNPSPVWTLIGRPVASIFPAEDGPMRVLARLDLLLVVLSLAFVGWAFGFEVLCVATLVWATNPLHRYLWMGDAFLRYPWFASCIIGICLLRKERHFGAGVLLALSSLLRIFPLLFIAGYGLGAIRRWLRGEGLGKGFREFAMGAALTSIALPLLAIPVCGRGSEVLTEFATNIGSWSSITPTNSLGLPALFSYTERMPEDELVGEEKFYNQAAKQRQRDALFSARKPLYFAVVAFFLLTLWRALERCEDWMAAALGFVLILLLIDIPVYYTSFMVAPVLLSERWPRIGISVLAAMIALCGATLVWWNQPFRWAIASPILLLVALYTLLELRSEKEAA